MDTMSRKSQKLIALGMALSLIVSAVWVPAGTARAEDPPTADGPILFYDDFEDGVADGWGGASGFAVTADGGSQVFRHTFTSGSTTRYMSAGNTAWTSYSVEAKVKNYTNDNTVGIYGRYRNADNYYALKVNTNHDVVTLNKLVNGTSTSLGSASLTLNSNTVYTLKLVMDGTSLTAYVDGLQVLSAVDTSLSSGKIAVGGYSKGSYSVDNVLVVDKRVASRMTAAPQNAVLLKEENKQYVAAIYDQSDIAISGLQPVWSSDDPAVASVNVSGIVTGVSAGSTVIRAVYGQLAASANVTVQEVVPEPPINTKRTLSPISVNGVLDESVWSIDRTARKQVLGSSDNTVMFGTLWDDNYLYVAAQVTDGNLYNDSTDAFDDDSVEVFIDSDHSRGSTYDVNDWHFRKGYNDSALFERLSETVGVLHGSSAVEGGYAVELAIPWKNFGITPSAGTEIGFDIAVNDDDNGGSREGQLVWAGIADNYKNTMAFGELVLSALVVGTTPPPDPTPQPVDRYVTPQGAGLKDGSSWANALQGDMAGGLQAAWEATGVTNTVYVGSGTYTVPQTLSIGKGGTDALHMKKLIGVDTGGGLPEFIGDYTLANQAQRSFINAKLGASFWWIQDIVIRNYYYGIYANGQHEGIRVFHVDMHDMSDGVYLWGKATRSNPNVGSHDIMIKDGDYTNYTKSAVRFRNGNYLASVINVNADAGGQANWASANFPLGFRIGNSPAESDYVFDHDIVFQDVTSRNSWQQDGSNYWNGDGFSAERAAYNLTYIRSKAFDNTDGGWDDKSRNPALIDTVSFGNKRNYRFWSTEGATFIRAIGAYSYRRGGSGDSVGVWLGGGGTLNAYYSTFYNNQNSEISLEDANKANIYDSIIGKSSSGSLYSTSGGTLTFYNSDTYIPNVQGTDPQFVNGSNADWEGGGSDFNSQLYGNSKGYVYPGPNSTPYTIQLSASSLAAGPLQTRTVTAQVYDSDHNLVADPGQVIWYSDNAYVSRLLQSRGAAAIVQALYAGETDIMAAYKGAEARIRITVTD